MPTFELEIRNVREDAEEAFEAHLRFQPLRTRFISGTAALRERPGQVKMLAPTGAFVWLAWTEPLAPGDSMRLTVEYVGEMPLAPDIQFVPNAELRELAGTPSPLKSIDGRHLETWSDAQLRRVEQLTKAHLEELTKGRRARFDCFRGDLLRYAEFFLNYDRATNENFLGDTPAIVTTIRETTASLRTRVVARATQVPVCEHDVPSHKSLSILSDLQLRVIRDEFHDPKTGIFDVHAFDDAFVAFAIGDLIPLQQSGWNARPDSANFYMFAEFAICAIQYGIETQTWLSLLPTFVMCQELYAQVFAPYCDTHDPPIVPPARRTFGMYTRWVGEELSNPQARVARLRRAYAQPKHRTLEHLVERHRDNLIHALPRGDDGTTDACTALNELSDQQPTTGDAMPDAEFKDVLNRIALYIGRYVSQNGGEKVEKTPKYVLVTPTALRSADERVPAKVFATLAAAEAEKASGSHAADTHILGPVAVVYDVDTDDGWDGTQTSHISIVDKELAMTGKRKGQPAEWRFSSDEFQTFIIVIPKRK